MEFSRKLLLCENLESVTRKIEDCFKVLRVIQRGLKSISMVFQRRLKQISGVL